MIPRPLLRLDHRPRARPIRRVPLSRLVKGALFALGMPDHAFCAVDVTARCNLRCKHCYFFEQGHDPERELSADEWFSLLCGLRRMAWPRPFFAYQCSWVGGEPLLRAEVIERCRHLFPYNIVVSNGMLRLPDWRDVHFFISVDGTRESHEAIRGAGSYDRVRANAERDDLDVMITCCINRLNLHCIEELMIEWNRTPVRHVAFEFHTPVRGLAADRELSLGPEERDRAVGLLLELKRVYGHFILPPARSYRLMRSQISRLTTDRCLYRTNAVVLGPDGRRKRPCMLGPKADCDRCGCIIPFVTRAQVDRREILRDLLSPLT
jgi:MoaA/NifB/PqqE/SkfB family radical SAM enzyme